MTQPAFSGNPLAIIRSRPYAGLLILGALLGVPLSAGAYFFLWLVGKLQTWIFVNLPSKFGLGTNPTWWPIVPLAIAGLLVGAIIRYLPGRGGHSPADGFKTGPLATPPMLPGVFLAALVSLSLGAVVGPEAPLIALGGGLALFAVGLLKRDLPRPAMMVIGATGSFAAVSALLGSPLLGAFLLMEAIGVSGGVGTLVLMPGLLASGIGALVFLGLNSLTGLGSVSLALPALPRVPDPTVGEFVWAIVIGVIAAVLGTAIRWAALAVRPTVERRLVLLTPVAGVAVALLAVGYRLSTGKPTTDVLFSGQSQLPDLVSGRAGYAWGALAVLLICKSVAYSISLAAFRGGPVFPAMFIGTVLGLLATHIGGVAPAAAIGIGVGAMSASMLRLPLTSVLLATLLLGSNGLTVMPLVIVVVVVSYMVSIWLGPAPAPVGEPATRTEEPQPST
ncbi:H+/Cl- antiporter ClcA [Jatrophihabitans sp. GAS493]|uniref:chloride channel protein n=1 Tax=Jatrophihabitans sp. GAS493 TaxID=1907575 RepID=UPI000BB900A5|nr:chloride channel protein [Jatrophihabitans sp. GAS493]SOD72826.1 H+/Cl- antiporter ClcA [Jatrophihabitans sp. GAS493]